MTILKSWGYYLGYQPGYLNDKRYSCKTACGNSATCSEIPQCYISDQLAINFRKADISNKQMAMLEFAAKVCEKSSDISDQDLQQLRGHGFNDEEIWDIASIASFFALSNRMANFAGMRPNDDFYTMGRQIVTTQEMTKK